MNIVIIQGRLGMDPEVKATQNSSVCNLSVATNERIKKGDEWEDHVEWHRVTCWGRLAENCGEYLSKGSKVLIRGCLRTRSYEKDGEKRYATEIRADDVTFLDGKPEEAPARGRGRERGEERPREREEPRRRKPAPRDDDSSYLDNDDAEDPFAPSPARGRR